MNLASTKLVTDVAALNGLKVQARADRGAAAGEVARQFEGLLVQMMIKSMRQASLGEGALDSQQSLYFRDLYDQQLAQHIAGKGLRLAEVIERQLGGPGAKTDSAAAPQGRDLASYRANPAPTLVQATPRAYDPDAEEPEERVATEEPDEAAEETPETAAGPAKRLESVDEFVAELLPWAQEAAAELGVSAEGLIAQAALETGWGRRVIRGAGGRDSYNLFGIKTGGRWEGERAHVSTLEYENGVAVQRKDYFRAYPSFQQCFADYVTFIRDNPRYREALSAADDAAYFKALQRAGYATDPSYANKVMSIRGSAQMQAALAAVQGKSG